MAKPKSQYVCNSCGAVYNVHFSPPHVSGICDKCQGALIQRPDDAEDIVQERLRVYAAQTKPLIAYYESQGNLSTIDGVNIWFVSRAAAESGYKVAISGLGADEILGGYPSFVDVPMIMKCAGSLPKVPLFGRWFRWITAGLVS